MATIVFSGGHELVAGEEYAQVVATIEAALERTPNPGHPSPRGWFLIRPTGNQEFVTVNPATIAYVKP